MSPWPGDSKIGCRKVRAKNILILAVLCACAISARAQGVITPPVTSFNPDTAMPSVNVPEFIITGKAAVELPKAAKPSVEIDSAYFRNKDLQGVGLDVPLNRDIGEQNLSLANEQRSLFARASIGHYSTTDYLVSGTDNIRGFNVDGNVSGNYTSGFIANTVSREFSVRAGVSKDINSEELIKSSNSMDLGYTRSSYSLYGGPQPTLVRSTGQIEFGVNSDMYLAEFPLAFSLGFNRFSLNDSWNNTESSLKFTASTQVQLQSGWLGFHGGFLFGNHTLSGSAYSQVPAPATPAAGANLSRSLYDLQLGGNYRGSFLSGNLSYSIGLVYYQYRDDSVNAVAKLYPDLRANYRLNDRVSLFAGFNGSVRRATLAGFISSDRYVSGSLALLSTQNRADFSLGSRIELRNDFVVMPEIDFRSVYNYPLFFSDSTNISRLMYAGKADITSLSVTASYTLDRLYSDLTLRYQAGTADSLSSIPNLPGFDANLGATYRITNEFVARASFLFLSSRYADLALSHKLDPVGLLNFRVSYDFRIAERPFQVFAGGDNILNEKYFIWQGYQEFPLTLYVGLSSKIL